MSRLTDLNRSAVDLHRIAAEALLVHVQDAKVVSTASDWAGHALTLSQRLRRAGFDTQADAIATAHTFNDFRDTCAEAAIALHHVTLDA